MGGVSKKSYGGDYVGNRRCKRYFFLEELVSTGFDGKVWYISPPQVVMITGSFDQYHMWFEVGEI